MNWFAEHKVSCAGHRGYIDQKALFTNLELEIPKTGRRQTDAEDGMSIAQLRAEIAQSLNQSATNVLDSHGGVVPDTEDTDTLLEGSDIEVLKRTLASSPNLLAPNIPHFDPCTIWLHDLSEDHTHSTYQITQIPVTDIVDPAIQLNSVAMAVISRKSTAPDFSYISQDGMRHLESGVTSTASVLFRSQKRANEFLKQLFYLKRQCQATSLGASQ